MTPTEEKPRAWRQAKFESLGFTKTEAYGLSLSKDKHGVPIYWGDVKAALDAGCSLEHALDIFVSDADDRLVLATANEDDE